MHSRLGGYIDLSCCGWSPRTVCGCHIWSPCATIGPLTIISQGSTDWPSKPLYDYLSACCIFSMAHFLMLKCNLLVFVQKTLSTLSRWAGLSYFYQTRCNILIFALSQQLTTPHQVRSKGAMLSKWIEYQVHY